MRRIAIFTIAVTLLSGCSMFREFQRPEIRGIEDIYGFEAADSACIADLGWRSFFSDTLLQALIDTALLHNADYLTACERITEAENLLKLSRFGLMPTISADAAFGLSGNAISSPISLKSSWEVDITARSYNNLRKARAELEQSEIARRSVQTALIADIATCYYTLEMLDAKRNVTRTTARNWKENVRIMRAMKEAGMTNEASVSHTEANSYSIEATLLDYEYSITQTENALALLLGVTPRHFERGSFDDERIPYDMTPGVPAALLSRRPDVMNAELNLRKAYYNTQIARSNFYPRITLNGQVGFETPFLLSLKAVEDILGAVGNRYSVKAAEARQREAFIAYRQTLLRAGSEVNDAFALANTAMSKKESRENQIQSLQSAVVSTRALMRHSQSTYLEVLTAQQSLLSALLLRIQDRHDAVRAKINLYRALGGGAEEEAKIIIFK